MSRPVLVPLLRTVCTGVLLLGGASAGLAQERVGVSSAVNQQATATPPGQGARPLIIGQDVVYNERITTTDAGQTQLLFVDQSSMTIGPNSDLTIDQFVYDPRTGTGKLAMSTTRGLLRYVGGKLSKQDEAVTMRTNSATLAVRGGAFLLNQPPGGSLEAVFIYGHGLTVTGTTGASQTVQRPGFAISIAGPGAAPTPPFPVPPGQLAQLVSQLDGRRGASGGARTVPTEQAVAASGVSQTISGNVTASVQQAAAQAPAATAPAAFNVAGAQTNTNVQTAVTSGVDCVSQGNCPPQTVTTTPTQPVAPTAPTGYGGFYKTTPGTGSSVGFVSFDPAFNIPYTGGQIGSDGFYTANLNGTTIRFPVAANGGFRTFTPADGTDSPFGPISGTSFITPDRTFLYSNNTEVDFTDEHSFVFGGMPVNPTFYQPKPNLQVTAYALQPDAALNSPIPYTTNNFGGSTPNAFVSPLVIVAAPNQQFGAGNAITDPNGATIRPKYAQVSFGVNGSGANQSSLLVVNTGTFFTTGDTGKVAASGPVRGSFQPDGNRANQVLIASGSATVPDGNGNNLFGGNNLTGFVLDQNGINPTTESVQQQLATAAQFNGTTTNYAFNQPAVSTGTLPFAIGTRTTQGQTGWFGGIMYPRQPGGGLPPAYAVQGATAVLTDATTNRVGATFGGSDVFSPSTSGINSLAIQFGGITGLNRGRDTFIDDNTFAATESVSNPSQINGNSLPLPAQNQNNAPTLGLVSAIPGTALANSLGVTPCDCQYLKWGFWTGQLNQVDSSGNITRSDRAFVNTWLAGVPTSAADLNTLQASAITGTYNGAAFGSVFNNGASYIAAGNFNGTYNFATQTGNVTISNFDGRTFSGPTATSTLASGSYAGSLAGPGVFGQFAGTFYGPMAANTGGTFGVRSAGTGAPTYLASGIFAGKR
jgi:trimeric autotransporter adhesin